VTFKADTLPVTLTEVPTKLPKKVVPVTLPVTLTFAAKTLPVVETMLLVVTALAAMFMYELKLAISFS
jgi:hypothetical protein